MSSLPNIIKPMQLDCIGSTTKKRWIGQFLVKCVITHADAFAIDRIYGAMTNNWPYDVDSKLKLKAQSLAQLSVRIMEGPEWWSASKEGQLLVDDEPVYELMLLCKEATDSWNTEVEKRAIVDDSNTVTRDAPKP